MDHIIYQISKIILIISSTNLDRQTLADNPITRIYINKTEIRNTFKTSTSYHHEILTPKVMKLLGRTKNKITKKKW